MKTIYTVLFIVIMTLIGRVEAVGRIQPVPEGTKIIQGAGESKPVHGVPILYRALQTRLRVC